MSDYTGARLGDRLPVHRAFVLAAVLLALAVVLGGGTAVRARTASPLALPSPVSGRTSAVCTVGAGDTGATPSPTPAASPTPEDGAEPDQDRPASTVSAVAVRPATATGSGKLTGALLGTSDGDLEVVEPGTGAQQPRVTGPLVLTGEGALATAGSGAVFSSDLRGETSGLMAAPCLTPGTEQWFAGVGSSDSDRTELILSNPDDGQAEVDLRFYGPQGRVVVPGSPGVVVGGRSARVVSVSSLVQDTGPLSVAVRAGEGRVSVAARRIRTEERRPAGADWQIPSVAPARSVVVAGVPGDAGPRSLEVVNPGPDRAAIAVEVLGLSGPFAPAGADTVEIAGESTASVPLEAGLAGESASIRLSSTTPVTAALVATSSRADAQPDLAIQSALPPLVGQGVSALATTTGETTSELVLSNGGDADSSVTFRVVSYAGVVLREDDILLAAGGSATRRLTSPGPSYVVVDVPEGSGVVGSVTMTQPEGDIAGLATVPLTSPDVAARAPVVVQDPAVGR